MKLAHVIALVLLVLLAGCAKHGTQIPHVTIQTATDAITVDVEVADDETEWSRGLMGWTYLAPNAGMLFVFPDEQYRSFWMKDTQLPLDIIYISADKKVVDIKTMKPCTAEPCATYPSGAPMMYALEVNAGFAKAKGVKIGDTVALEG